MLKSWSEPSSSSYSQLAIPLPPQSLVSGGVDSTVCTALLNTALGPERVVAVHIDNGFMRKNESAKVKESLENLGLKLHSEPFSHTSHCPPSNTSLSSSLPVVKASQTFYTSQTIIMYQSPDGLQQRYTHMLQAVTNPEEKRRIIGDTFMKVGEGGGVSPVTIEDLSFPLQVADTVMSDLQLKADSVFLAQGTLRPDLIESASALASVRANVIKTHHNDTELVRELRNRVRDVASPCSEIRSTEFLPLGRVA